MRDHAQRQRLDGKVALITGATGGIGEASARLSLELGAKVVLVGRSPDKLAATRDRLGAFVTNEEVAHLLAFLASDASSYCTGSIHMIDGGYVAA